ncbi:glycosyltransferase family 2 protein [Mesorhizobium sp. CAU 1741]|uniref:glycosyltransferase family 2 protein n=1 Tax=Mesorhizobium sp. CAU 1741 TaxID=3140366 RepID=UPI00325B4E8E
MDVVVIVAARNVEATIAHALSSALSQRQTAELIVVDDASTDRTSEVARGAEDGTGRLKVLTLDKQVGPSRARNIAIDASRANLIAVLDGDDVFLPGRFDWLLQDDGWDLVADNIVMYRSMETPLDTAVKASRGGASSSRPVLTLKRFVEGNISGFLPRRELGFLKPVMRRDFLDRAGLRYNEAIRFAEDYDLYCRALVAGARFTFDPRAGYGALVHSSSLSSTHSSSDLGGVIGIDERLLASESLDPGSRDVLYRHLRQVTFKYHYRMLLDRRQKYGLASAVREILATPTLIPATLMQFATDKLRPLSPGLFLNSGDTPNLLVSPDFPIISR